MHRNTDDVGAVGKDDSIDEGGEASECVQTLSAAPMRPPYWCVVLISEHRAPASFETLIRWTRAGRQT